MFILEPVAVCQQPSMEVPNNSLIVMAGGTPFEGHAANTHVQVRSSPVRRPKPRAGCVSTDRWDARRRDTSPLPPPSHPRPVSRSQPATALRRPPQSNERRPLPEEGPSLVLRSHVEQVESLPPLVRIRVRLLANPPEMSRKAVAQELPFLGYRYSEDIETLKSRLREPLFRGA